MGISQALRYIHYGCRPLYRCMSSVKSSPIMAIRREDNSIWERRAPLAPSHVKKLVKQGTKVIVQPSNRRAYSMQDYETAGAHVQEDMSEATLILGVKQVPIDLLEAEKTYVFFSHTIKAQEANMPLLEAILEKKIRLIDYEKMNGPDGRRVVAFGKYAGVAGMIDILHGLGLRLLALGHHTPFMYISPSHNYRNSEMAKQSLRDAGYEVALGLMPKSLGPLTFVFTGSGNVTQGAMEMFEQFPFEMVEPVNLPQVAQHGSTNKLYATIISRKDHLVRKEGGAFCPDEYDKYPDRYVSTFSRTIAPYASCLINGIYWAPDSPRLISIPDAKTLLRPSPVPWLPTLPGCPKLPHRLLAICDISADPGGSIEFVKECTTIDHPFSLYDADEHINSESFSGDGVLICSIDNMPAQIPIEATNFFGGRLLPYVPELVKSNAKTSFDDYDASPVVKDAVIASNGSLTPNFEYISSLRMQTRSQHKAAMMQAKTSKSVLILGAGYVSGPVVEYLTRDDDFGVTVASHMQSELDNLSSKYNITPLLMDMVRSKDELELLIQSHDITVSLLPFIMHPDIAELCIKYRKNMATASYRSPRMMSLNQQAVDAGITVLNEIGVDPGIDHLLAMEAFDEVHLHGGKVTSFVSWCGGLPAPQCADNPLRYKFSWSPKGVLGGALRGAQYLKDRKIIEILDGQLMDNAESLSFLLGFNIEGYPNRDSLPYIELYGINSAHTIVRGTIRYKGFAPMMKALMKIGLTSDNNHPSLHKDGPEITWKQFVSQLVNQPADMMLPTLKSNIAEKFDLLPHLVDGLENLGLFGEEPVDRQGTVIDTLSNYLSKRLSYQAGEPDIIILRHDIGVQWPDQTKEVKHVDLVVYGSIKQGGHTAMASTVGYPLGIATKMILNGEIQTKGMILPLTSDIYRPVLKRLRNEGIEARVHST